MDPTSLALSGAALANSQHAVDLAEEAKCQAFMPTFSDTTATVETRHQYAECVARLYPNPMTNTDILAVKVLIIAGIVGAIIGGFKMSDEELPDIALGVLLGAVIVPFAVVAFAGIVCAIKFLFTA